ncbi:MAG: 4'-phosphopantetheinyl transferase superfamily protein, partial [Planctomycetota bacterium]|nr:4'-phosphopantetheinyl transferase superfamily protein [Planctomycetota bacterium]
MNSPSAAEGIRPGFWGGGEGLHYPDGDIGGGGGAGRADGRAELYYGRGAGVGREARESLLSWLDPGEEERRNRRLFPKDRLNYGLSRALVRYALSLWWRGRHGGGDWEVKPAAWRFAADARGRPEAILPAELAARGAAPPRFSLSHTAAATAVAVAGTGKVGVDLESRRRQVDGLSLARRFLAGCEFRDVAGRSRPGERRDRFLLYWTLKEAYLKALGLGLAGKLSSFAVRPGPGGAVLLYDRERPAGDWRFFTYRLPGGIAAALALEGAGPPPSG